MHPQPATTTTTPTDARAPFTDLHGRTVRDLRISVTDRCNLRCVYCMPAEGMAWLPKSDLLTFEELARVAQIGVAHGIEGIRLTGGEPTVRADLVELVRRLRALSPALDLSLTTNGLKLVELAAPLRAAGLDRVNVSLDSLRRERFHAIARRDRLADVLAGLAAARDAGFAPVKVNVVLMRGVNDDEVVELARWARAEGYELRFIEWMPLDAGHTWDRSQVVPADEVLATLAGAFELGPEDGDDPTAPARTFRYRDGGRVGVIAPVTRPFCGRCDRIRLTADGQVRTCLFSHREYDVRGLLRAGGDDAALAELLAAAVRRKAPGHLVGQAAFRQPARGMSAIGG